MTNKVLIIGSEGTIGNALVNQFEGGYEVSTISRSQLEYTEQALANKYAELEQTGRFKHIICCIGVLEDDIVKPEKSIRQLNSEVLMHYFNVNSVLPALCIKQFANLLSKDPNQGTSTFSCLSAMVGSTRDNKLGGWYGYRASKAALNSLIKTASIEIKRTNSQAAIVAIHPGTTKSRLTEPYAKNIDPAKYYTPEQTAARIATVLNQLLPSDTGNFLNWDSNRLSW